MESNLEFGNKIVKPNIRMSYDLKDVLYDHEWLMKADNFELYYMYRRLSLSKNDALTMKEHGLRYDITVIPPCMMGCEYVKTAGHYHPEVPGTAITYPEVYEVLNGEAIYMMQKLENVRIEDVMLVKAKPGDKVIIPPGYGHLTINTSNKVLKMANWVAKDFDSIYSPIREKGGGAYFILKDGIIKNPKYIDLPDIHLFRPTNFKELGFERSKEMYELVRDISRLEFLTKPQEYEWLFEKVLKNL